MTLPHVNEVLKNVVIGYTQDEIQQIVDEHNRYRSVEALFGGATNMRKLVRLPVHNYCHVPGGWGLPQNHPIQHGHCP